MKRWISHTLLVLMLMSPLVFLGGITTFDDIVATGDITAGDDLSATDDLSANGDLSVGAMLYTTKQAALTVTNNGTVTPVGAYQQLTAAGAVATSSITVGSAGSLVTLVNIASNTITFTDTGTLKLSGNAVLGQYDSLTLLSDGTNLVQVGKSDN